jgi:hypothetical protein
MHSQDLWAATAKFGPLHEPIAVENEDFRTGFLPGIYVAGTVTTIIHFHYCHVRFTEAGNRIKSRDRLFVA